MTSSRQSGFPLAALFLLVAGIALMMAGPSVELARLLRQEHVSLPQQYVNPYAAPPAVPSDAQIAFSLVCGGIIGAVLGAIAGCMAERWFRGAVLGLITGWCAGLLAAAHLVVEPDLRTVAAGSAMLIVGSLIYRLKFKQPALPAPYLDEEFAGGVPAALPGATAEH